MLELSHRKQVQLSPILQFRIVLTPFSWSEPAFWYFQPQVLYTLYPPHSLPDRVWPYSLKIQNSDMRQPLLAPFISWQDLLLLGQVHPLFQHFILK